MIGACSLPTGWEQEEDHPGPDLHHSDQEAKDVLLPGVAGAQNSLQALCQPLLLLCHRGMWASTVLLYIYNFFQNHENDHEVL